MQSHYTWFCMHFVSPKTSNMTAMKVKNHQTFSQCPISKPNKLYTPTWNSRQCAALPLSIVDKTCTATCVTDDRHDDTIGDTTKPRLKVGQSFGTVDWLHWQENHAFPWRWAARSLKAFVAKRGCIQTSHVLWTASVWSDFKHTFGADPPTKQRKFNGGFKGAKRTVEIPFTVWFEGTFGTQSSIARITSVSEVGLCWLILFAFNFWF